MLRVINIFLHSILQSLGVKRLGKNEFAYLEKLPFRMGSDAWNQRLKEARTKNEKPKEVNCIGTTKFEIVGRKLTLRIFNEKIQHWQEVIGVEYQDVCPVCGTLMLVRAVQGSTWLALCSKECYEKYDALKKEAEAAADVAVIDSTNITAGQPIIDSEGPWKTEG